MTMEGTRRDWESIARGLRTVAASLDRFAAAIRATGMFKELGAASAGMSEHLGAIAERILEVLGREGK